MEVKNKYENYIENFISENNIKEKEQFVYRGFIDLLVDMDTYITKWKNKDLDIFIESLQSTSVNTIDKYLQYIKKFYKFVCKKENIVSKHLFLSYDKNKYIDYNKLKTTILNDQQYINLKNSFGYLYDGKEYNTRDKLMIELAYNGLTAYDIKHLKINDVKLNNSQSAEIYLHDRIIKIDDEEVIKDIQKTINQDYYYIEPTENRKHQLRKLKDTEYIIRPVKTNQGKNDTVSNPSQILKKAFEKMQDYYPDKNIDLSMLTLEDIRRSKVIQMLKNEVPIEEVSSFLGKKSNCDLYWLKDLANNLKNQKKW